MIRALIADKQVSKQEGKPAGGQAGKRAGKQASMVVYKTIFSGTNLDDSSSLAISNSNVSSNTG